jgi:pyrroloquinoline quinone biosynthesis protein D
MALAALRRMQVAESSRPVLARHARLRFDKMRDRWVLLVPERVLAPDEVAIEVLQLCDGDRDVAGIIDLLAAKYAAAREVIAADVIELLQDLALKGFLVNAREKVQ